MIKYILFFVSVLPIGCASVISSHLDDTKSSFHMSLDYFDGDTVSLFINQQEILRNEILTFPKFNSLTGVYDGTPYPELRFNKDSLVVNVRGNNRYISSYVKSTRLKLYIKKNSTDVFEKEFNLKNGKFFLVGEFQDSLSKLKYFFKNKGSSV